MPETLSQGSKAIVGFISFTQKLFTRKIGCIIKTQYICITSLKEIMFSEVHFWYEQKNQFIIPDTHSCIGMCKLFSGKGLLPEH